MEYYLMTTFSNDQKQEIVNKLNERKVNLPCPRCNGNNFTLMDGYFNQPIQYDLSKVKIGGTSIPSVLTICNNCGYLSQHALGTLGLLPKKDEDENGK